MIDSAKNFRVLTQFIKQAGLKPDEYGNARFEAWVTYKCRQERMAAKTIVRLVRNGNNDGNVEVEETDELDVESHHLGYSARYQSYSIRRATNALVIKGTSQSGPMYEVEIRAT